ncbi:MAG: DedA family protein [Anaerolineaceae bacterium]|nr:DedA family protein [Anaerolineaceae bacterium]
MEVIQSVFEWFINFVLHMDEQLPIIIGQIGGWTYLVLFVVIFIETGVVIMPFLPGDSLLFAAGAVAANPETGLNNWVLFGLLATAAVLGDTANYWIGHFIGPKVFTQESRFLKKEHLDRTHAFYQKHGGKTIFLARFIPIIRTFAPFVAGIGKMNYGYFISYNIIGGIVWTGLFLMAGHFFGNLPVVKENFSLVIIAIIVISVLPAVFEYIKGRREKPVPTPVE